MARFLRANHYEQTLQAFLVEAGLPEDAGALTKDALTLETLIHEKSIYDLSQSFVKLGADDSHQAWTPSAPSTPRLVENVGTSANILHTSIESTRTAADATRAAQQLLIATTADKRIHLLSVADDLALSSVSIEPHDSPTLCCCVLEKSFMLTGSMAGKLTLIDIATGQTLDQRTDHQKYLVRISTAAAPDAGIWIATAAWDGKVLLYLFDPSHGLRKLGSPRGRVELSSNPECISFCQHPELQQPALLISRKDSTFLYYYATPPVTLAQTASSTPLPYLGRQNLAPHSNAWIAFTPSAFAISPQDPSLVAVATSHTPFLKIIVARLLMPPPQPADACARDDAARSATSQHPTQAAQARADLALQKREDAAILVQNSTMAPQTAYSTPALAWRPDGTGIWVNGDDGLVRGIEATTGKIVATLKGMHDVGTKIRCLCTGLVETRNGASQEWVVSGGFDRRLVVWS